MLDTLKGSKLFESPNDCYVTMHPELRTASNKAINSDKLIDKDNPSALWTTMMAHLTYI